MIAGFKKFILQGNVVDLAVGVVIGAAFGALVSQFTASFINPVIAAVMGGEGTGGTFDINGETVDYGAFITAVITFLLTAAAVYFVVVVPMNMLRDRRNKGEEGEVEPSNEEKMLLLLQQIADK